MPRVTDTDGLLALCRNAEKGPRGRPRNRSVFTDKLAESVHPDGKHLCAMSFDHNGVELRTRWIVRLKDGEGQDMGAGIWGTEIWLDVDYEYFENWTFEVSDEGEEQ